MTTVDNDAILLASASPRRRELLDQIGVHYATVAHSADESARSKETPSAYVQRVARDKAISVAGRYPGRTVLGADTAVVCDERILGKPGNREEARAMLASLSGRSHQVCSAVVLCRDSACRTALSVSRVTFRVIEAREIADYWASGEPLDKAGGYAIQGLGAIFVQHIEGSYSGIMGLPLFETAPLLSAFGVATALSRAVSRDKDDGARP